MLVEAGRRVRETVIDRIVDRARRTDAVVLLAGGLALLPALVALAAALREPWIPTTDWARIELAVRDVGTGDTPLIGAYSRFGWHHPGPLMFYLLAVPYRLLPAEHALLSAAAIVNLLFTLAFILLAIRWPRGRALLALVLLALFQHNIRIGDLADPWNPTLMLMPMAVFVVLCVEIAEGRRAWPLVAAVAVGSLIGQSHVGLMVPMFVIGGTALGVQHWRSRRAAPDVRRLGHRDLGIAAGAGVVLWIPPLIDHVAGTGNLGSLARFALGREEVSDRALEQGALSPGEIVSSVSWLLQPFGPWMQRPGTVWLWGFPVLGEASPLWLLVIGVIIAGTFILARKAAGTWVTGAGAVATAGVVSACFSMATLRGARYYYLGRWTGVVVLVMLLAFGSALAAHLGRSPQVARARARIADGRARRVLAAVPAVLVGAAVVPTVAEKPWQPVEDHSDAYRRLEPEIERAVSEEDPFVTSLDRNWILFNEVTHGLVVWLERDGVDWVDPASEPVTGGYFYQVEPLDQAERRGALADIVEIVATSGTPSGPLDARRELALTRIPVELLQDLDLSGEEDIPDGPVNRPRRP